jgi:hypothetical protein
MFGTPRRRRKFRHLKRAAFVLPESRQKQEKDHERGIGTAAG